MSHFARLAGMAAIASALAGCYVVPLNHYPSGGHGPSGVNMSQGTTFVPVSAVRPPFSARLYPSNDTASALGGFAGIITNPERGHGEFSFTLGGESFAGEATRTPNSSKGIANASGNRGGYVRCDYTMSSSALGTGNCTFSNGALYSMHISQ